MKLKKARIGRNKKTGRFATVKQAEKAKKSYKIETIKNNSF